LRADEKRNTLPIAKFGANGTVEQVYPGAKSAHLTVRLDGGHSVLCPADAVERVHSAAVGMQGLLEDVRAFHEMTGAHIGTEPDAPSFRRVELRDRLIDEEVNKELRPALLSGDLVKIADGLADSIFVLVGTAIEYGIPLDRVWHAVQQANMAKRDPVTGAIRRDPGGKILKPEGWKEPNIIESLFA
jgi:predicted HAD superfamily Cof-like phosphohydrolase